MPALPTTKRARPKPDWREMQMCLRLKNLTVQVIDGFQYGTLVVHMSIPQENDCMWVVTHRPSQLAVVRLEKFEDCTAFAEKLWDMHELLMDQPGENINIAKMPDSTISWIKACNAAKRLL